MPKVCGLFESLPMEEPYLFSCILNAMAAGYMSMGS